MLVLLQESIFVLQLLHILILRLHVLSIRFWGSQMTLLIQTVFLHSLSRRPQYQPLSLKRLQYLIDLGRVDPTEPIDLTQLVNARGVTIQPLKRDYGVQLVDEVITAFSNHTFILEFV